MGLLVFDKAGNLISKYSAQGAGELDDLKAELKKPVSLYNIQKERRGLTE